MSYTPVELVQQKYQSTDVARISKKWNKRTLKSSQFHWPNEGTFDLEAINNIRIMIEKREKKLRDELIAIKGFLKIAEEKLEAAECSEKGNLLETAFPQTQSPASSTSTGLYPVLTAEDNSETRDDNVQPKRVTSTVVVVLSDPSSIGMAGGPQCPQVWGRGAPGQRNFGRGGRAGFNPTRNNPFPCFVCGKVGHRARNCYFRAQRGRGNFGRGGSPTDGPQ